MKKITLTMMLSELYGRTKYKEHFKVGNQYWWLTHPEEEVAKDLKLDHAEWLKLEISYMRSGVLFYRVLDERSEGKEYYMPLDCIKAMQLIPAYFNPTRELDLHGISDKYYRFDDDHTIIIDWNNDPEVTPEDEAERINNPVWLD